LCSIPTIQTLLQDIVNVHLNHALSLQKEQEITQEQHPKPIQEESQDEYGQFDLNWDDPMVLAALNNAAEPAPVSVPVPTTQYTYQSLIEVGRSILILPIPELKLTIDSTRQLFKNAIASHTLFENIINAFESRRQ